MRTPNEQLEAQERRRKMQTVVDRSSLLPETDEDGYLKKEGAWTKEVAELLAQKILPGELTEDHWKVINYLRHYYAEFRAVPPVRKLARDTGISLRELKELFPDGVTPDACRMAGIPKYVVTVFHRPAYTSQDDL